MIKISIKFGAILFITFIVKHKKLMQFMIHNKLFRVVEFAWKLCIMFVNVLNKCTTTCQKKIYIKNRLNCCKPNKINK